MMRWPIAPSTSGKRGIPAAPPEPDPLKPQIAPFAGLLPPVRTRCYGPRAENLGKGLTIMTAGKPWYRVLYIQVLIAIALGVLVGHFYPDAGKSVKWLGDGFIGLIKMMIAPAIFCTVVHGIASIGDMSKVGRVGAKTLFYFEAVSTLALAIGLIVGEVMQPGVGFNIDVATLDPKAVASYVTRAKEDGVVAHLLAIIPNSFVGALALGDLLQVLLGAVLAGFSVSLMGPIG